MLFVATVLFSSVLTSLAAEYVILLPEDNLAFPRSGISAARDVTDNPRRYIGRTFSFFVNGDYSVYMHARIDGAANQADRKVEFYFSTAVEYENFEIKKIEFDAGDLKWTAKCLDPTSNSATYEDKQIVVLYIE